MDATTKHTHTHEGGRAITPKMKGKTPVSLEASEISIPPPHSLFIWLKLSPNMVHCIVNWKYALVNGIGYYF